VDAVWVENMNSVMDDNKLLTLPNGERVRLAGHVKLLFEVADLQYASPATISRRGGGWAAFCGVFCGCVAPVRVHAA
jgi:dynein heavy chain